MTKNARVIHGVLRPGDPCPVCKDDPARRARMRPYTCACGGSGRWRFRDTRRGGKAGDEHRPWTAWEDRVICACFTLRDPELEAWRRLFRLNAKRSYDAVLNRYLKLSASANRNRNRMSKGDIPAADDVILSETGRPI